MNDLTEEKVNEIDTILNEKINSEFNNKEKLQSIIEEFFNQSFFIGEQKNNELIDDSLIKEPYNQDFFNQSSFIGEQKNIETIGDSLIKKPYNQDIVKEIQKIEPVKIKNYYFDLPKKIITGAHTGPITAISFSEDSNFLVTGSRDKTVILWDLKQHRLVRVFKGHTDTVNSVAILRNNDYIASGSADETIIV